MRNGLNVLNCNITRIGTIIEEKIQNNMNQYGRKNDVIIRNVAQNENQNLTTVIHKIAQKLGIDMRGFDITAIHRLQANRGIQPILELISAAKLKKHVGKVLELDTSMATCFDDHWTPFYQGKLGNFPSP